MLKTYQRDTKSFEFLRDKNSEELKIRKTHFAMASLRNDTTSLCNGHVFFTKVVCKYFINQDVYMHFCSSGSPAFTDKASIFSATGYTGK